MFWKDIADVKREMNVLKSSMLRIESYLCEMNRFAKENPLEYKIQDLEDVIFKAFVEKSKKDSSKNPKTASKKKVSQGQ